MYFESFEVKKTVYQNQYTNPEELRTLLRENQLLGEAARLQAAFLDMTRRSSRGKVAVKISRSAESDAYVLTVRSTGHHGRGGAREWAVEVWLSSPGEIERPTGPDVDLVVVHVTSKSTGDWHRYEMLQRHASSAETAAESVWSQLFAQQAWNLFSEVRFAEEIEAAKDEQEDDGLMQWERQLLGRWYYEQDRDGTFFVGHWPDNTGPQGFVLDDVFSTEAAARARVAELDPQQRDN